MAAGRLEYSGQSSNHARYPPLLGHTSTLLFLDRVSTYAFGHETDRHGRYKRKNNRLIRRLCAPNPMEDVPHQDSAKNQKTTSLNLIMLTRVILGLLLGPQRSPPGWCIYKLLYFTAVCIYTTKSSTPAISLFFLGPNPVVVYIFGVPIIVENIRIRHTKSFPTMRHHIGAKDWKTITAVRTSNSC